jgi:hypothetical protein
MQIIEVFMVPRGNSDEENFPEPKFFSFKDEAKQMI